MKYFWRHFSRDIPTTRECRTFASSSPRFFSRETHPTPLLKARPIASLYNDITGITKGQKGHLTDDRNIHECRPSGVTVRPPSSPPPLFFLSSLLSRRCIHGQILVNRASKLQVYTQTSNTYNQPQVGISDEMTASRIYNQPTLYMIAKLTPFCPSPGCFRSASRRPSSPASDRGLPPPNPRPSG